MRCNDLRHAAPHGYRASGLMWMAYPSDAFGRPAAVRTASRTKSPERPHLRARPSPSSGLIQLAQSPLTKSRFVQIAPTCVRQTPTPDHPDLGRRDPGPGRALRPQLKRRTPRCPQARMVRSDRFERHRRARRPRSIVTAARAHGPRVHRELRRLPAQRQSAANDETDAPPGAVEPIRSGGELRPDCRTSHAAKHSCPVKPYLPLIGWIIC